MTLKDFAPRFLDGYAKANRQKPSGIVATDSILNVHLVPGFGGQALDTISTEDVQRLKSGLRDRAPKTVNNVLTVLNTLLKAAVEWKVIDRMPCAIRLLKVPKASMGFYDVEEYGRLREAAAGLSRTTSLIVLLGGDAGLRCGEMIALEWGDVDLVKRQLTVQRSTWRGHVTAPKGGRVRYVPLTRRLVEALRDHRHLRSPRVLGPSDGDGSPLTWDVASRPCPAGGQTRTDHQEWHERHPPAAPHVLLAPRDARRSRARDPGARGASGSRHDAAVHAPQSRGARWRDSAAGGGRFWVRAWRNSGDGRS